MRTVRTPRVQLALVTAQNAVALWKVLQQPDLRTFQDLPSLGPAAFSEMVSRRPRQLRPGTNGRFEWLVGVAGVRKPVGWVSLRIAERDTTCGEIGYSIVRDFRGRGIAAQAVRLLLEQAFVQGGLARVIAYCVPENEASRRLLRSAGFVQKERLPHGATVSGRIVDVLAHHLDRERWSGSGKSIVMPASVYPA